MKHLLSLLLAIVLIGGLAVEAFALPPECSGWVGDCFISATYVEGSGTSWGASCADGYEDYGTVGGNQIPDICG